jgi:excisionase family DNA binding protein
MEVAAAYAIKLSKSRGLAEVGSDELLLGCLRAVSRFGVVSLRPLLLDLEELGVDWLREPEASGGKVAYSAAVVALFDRAALVAKSDASDGVDVEHLLVAFAGDDDGLMGELKRKHGLTSASWRAAVAQYASSRRAVESLRVADESSAVSTREYLTPEEAAAELGLHVQTLRGSVRSGKLPALRIAGERAIRIRRSDLESVMEPLVPQAVVRDEP